MEEEKNEGVELLLQRIHHTNNSTYGALFDHYENQLCFSIEDTFREDKVKGVTRIPAGFYQIKYRKVLSPKTKQYKEIYPDFFSWHLELQGVPNFEYVYIHHGNTHENTDGCILTNEGVHKSPSGDYVGSSSRKVFEEVYKYISTLLEDGVEVWIRVRDEDVFKQPF